MLKRQLGYILSTSARPYLQAWSAIFVRETSGILVEIASIKGIRKCFPYRSMRSSSNGRRPSSTDTVTFNRGTRRRNFVSLRRLDEEEEEEGPATLSTPSPLPFASISLRKPTRSLVEPRCKRGYPYTRLLTRL